MNKLLLILLVLISLVSCASSSKYSEKTENIEDILNFAEAHASTGGRRILEVSRSMIADQEIIIGGCWHYINTVFDKAGYSGKTRVTVFKSKFKGPYVSTDLIRPGDWLYFVNHSYNDIEHSAIFIGWINEEKKVALTVSYVGGNQKKPANYKQFVLDKTYNIIRAQD